MTVYGKSDGGTQPCQSAYYASSDGINYSLISGYGKSGRCTYKPATPGYYKIKVIAKAYNGSTAEKVISVTVKKNTNTSLSNKSSITTTSSVEKGTTVILNASASGGTQPYKYAYYYRFGNGSWKTASAYSTGTSSSIKLSSVGTYNLKVDVKDEAGKVVSKTFTVNSLSGSSSGKSETLNVNYGGSAVLKAANVSSGAVYSFYYKRSGDSAFTMLSSYGSTSSVSFRPRQIGSYNVVIYTKANNKVTSKTVTLYASISSVAKNELDRINAERRKAGVPALTLDNELSFAAGVRAEELEKSYSHKRPDGRSCFTVLSDYGITYKSSVTENVAYGYKDYTAVMDAWMRSSGHKANILNKNFTKVGLGINGKYWSQMFSN